MINNEFQPETLAYINEVNIEYRKSLGQYFTPRSIREQLLEKLPDKESPLILDPGCGTGEFLLTAQKYFKNPKLYGWDIDESLVRISQELVPGARIEKADALTRSDYGKYDFVIGNPPYYEFRPDMGLKQKFGVVINGRANIYSLFIYQGIKLLKRGGYLAYVVSPSMNNGAFFANLRNYIVEHCNIEYLSVLDSPDLFDGALQSVMLLILKKGQNKGKYIFRKNGILIFSERVDYLTKAFAGKETLSGLGYTVKTGRLVWNENKPLLTDEARGNIPLIWSYNVTRDGLKLGNHKRPQYVKIAESYDAGPAIVVNRIVGRPGSGRIRAALVPQGIKFIGENHVNVILPPKRTRLTPTRKTVRLEDILRQLNSPEKVRVIQSITGNTQISKNELENMFPVDYQ
ncbi:MAG: N-6 DNA methylase [Dehalococcoidales bacterium]|nr:N-6 DNA methylase [Dehalococcoidales bacterium]